MSGDAAVQWLVVGAFERPVTGPDLGAGQQRALHPGAVQLGLAGGQAQSVASRCQRRQARLYPGADGDQRRVLRGDGRSDGLQTGLSIASTQ